MHRVYTVPFYLYSNIYNTHTFMTTSHLVMKSIDTVADIWKPAWSSEAPPTVVRISVSYLNVYVVPCS